MDVRNASESRDDILVKLAWAGDLDAFNDLVIRYQEMAYNHACALLMDGALAEDITQDSFTKAFQNIHRFQSGSFRGWLLKIVTNSAYDILRRSRRQLTQPLFPVDETGQEVESPSWLADPSMSVERAVEQNDLSREICRLLGELPVVYRVVLTLIDVYELDYTEAAQALGIPVGTVKSRLARARLKMKEKLMNGQEHGILVTSTRIRLVA